MKALFLFLVLTFSIGAIANDKGNLDSLNHYSSMKTQEVLFELGMDMTENLLVPLSEKNTSVLKDHSSLPDLISVLMDRDEWLLLSDVTVGNELFVQAFSNNDLTLLKEFWLKTEAAVKPLVGNVKWQKFENMMNTKNLGYKI